MPQDGYTPLLWAANGGHEGVVRQLLEAKAAVDAADKVSLFDSVLPLARLAWLMRIWMRFLVLRWRLAVRARLSMDMHLSIVDG